MLARAARVLLVLGLAWIPGTVAVAQVIPTLPGGIPTPAQAQQMLQNNPNLIQRLQQMMQQSGMSPGDIRARLRAQGYPESLLDQYLPGGTRPDSTFVPGEDVFAAVRALGLTDTLAVDSLTTFAKTKRVAKTKL